MPNVKANGIQLEYDTFGGDASPPLLMITGLGAQMIFWPEEFCEALAGRGLFVIRFDNRDTGLSTRFEETGKPNIMKALGAALQGESISAPYTLDDMANDAAGLLDVLGIDKAHICGMSMGGMIAQAMAIRHPSRVSSLISIYSSTGNPGLPPPRSEVMNVMLDPPPKERQAFIDYSVNAFKLLAGRGFPFDEGFHRDLAAHAYDRAFYPQGAARQIVAILAHGNRKPALSNVTVPTLVIHGTDDPIVPVEGGKDTAEAIPGAKLMIIGGMGHDIPHMGGAWLQLIDALVDHIKNSGSG